MSITTPIGALLHRAVTIALWTREHKARGRLCTELVTGNDDAAQEARREIEQAQATRAELETWQHDVHARIDGVRR